MDTDEEPSGLSLSSETKTGHAGGGTTCIVVGLKPGLFTRVILYTGAAKDTIVVPITALLYEAEKVKLFTVSGDRAEEMQVRIGSKYGEMMEITEGIKEGEKIVVAGQQSLSEGVKVSVQVREGSKQ